MLRILIAVCLTTLIFACNKSEDRQFVPKPKGYNRIALPEHSYQKLPSKYPYEFEYSRYAKILPDTFHNAEPNWIFIHYPNLNANIQLTYKLVKGDPKRLLAFIEDAYKLSSKHQIRASSIQEKVALSQTGKTYNLFRLSGDIPSPYQFYTTDSSRNYLRGAIYLPTATKNDSLAPVIEYLQKDLIHLLNTLQWRTH